MFIMFISNEAIPHVVITSTAPRQGTDARIIETRKTVPGLRVLDKWAVLIGGGANHRMGLFDMVMIKNNHVDAAGGITPAVHACTVRVGLRMTAIEGVGFKVMSALHACTVRLRARVTECEKFILSVQGKASQG